MSGRQCAPMSRGRELLSSHSAGSCLPRWCKRARRRDIASPPGAVDQRWAVRGHAGFSKSNTRAGILFCSVSRSPKCWPLVGLRQDCQTDPYMWVYFLLLSSYSGIFNRKWWFWCPTICFFQNLNPLIAVVCLPWCLFSYDFPLNQSHFCVVHTEQVWNVSISLLCFLAFSRETASWLYRFPGAG